MSNVLLFSALFDVINLLKRVFYRWKMNNALSGSTCSSIQWISTWDRPVRTGRLKAHYLQLNWSFDHRADDLGGLRGPRRPKPSLIAIVHPAAFKESPPKSKGLLVNVHFQWLRSDELFIRFAACALTSLRLKVSLTLFQSAGKTFQPKKSTRFYSWQPSIHSLNPLISIFSTQSNRSTTTTANSLVS